MKKKVYWIAVQPTPYNFYLYQNLKKSEVFDFKFCYSIKQEKNLPFDFEKISFSDDYFFNRWLGLDLTILRKSFDKDSVFVVVGWEDINKLLILLIRRILGLPYAFWTDSINPVTTLQSNTFFKIKKWLLKKSDVLFTTGNFGVQKMLETELFTDKDRLVALPFFVELPTNFEKKSYIPDQEPLKILLLARLMPGKGIINSIMAIAQLQKEGYDVILNIGGIGSYKDVLEEVINKEMLTDRVHLLGWLDAKKIVEYRTSSHVLLHAVDAHDPFPLVVLESLANGLPVIGTNLAGSVSDRVINGYNGYICNSINPSDIAASIKNVIVSKNLSELSANARKTAEEWPGDKGLEIVETALQRIVVE